MKRSARKNDISSTGADAKDMGIGNWITISSPEQLFKLNIDVDFKKLNYNPLNSIL